MPLRATPGSSVHQALLSMGFSRQEYWSELPFLSPLINPRNNYYCYLFALEILCIFKYFKVSSVNWLIVNKFIRSLPLLRHQSGQRRGLHGCVPSDFSCVQSLEPYELQPARLLCPWDSPGKNRGVGCHFLLQETFATQGSNSYLLCLLHCQVGSLPQSHLGNTKRRWLRQCNNLKS